jgi:hypothetical protein
MLQHMLHLRAWEGLRVYVVQSISLAQMLYANVVYARRHGARRFTDLVDDCWELFWENWTVLTGRGCH